MLYSPLTVILVFIQQLQCVRVRALFILCMPFLLNACSIIGSQQVYVKKITSSQKHREVMKDAQQHYFKQFTPQQVIPLNESKVFHYQFDEPKRRLLSKARQSSIAMKAPKQQLALARNEYRSANGHRCKKVSSSSMAEQNVVCYIDGRWKQPAAIGLSY